MHKHQKYSLKDSGGTLDHNFDLSESFTCRPSKNIGSQKITENRKISILGLEKSASTTSTQKFGQIRPYFSKTAHQKRSNDTLFGPRVPKYGSRQSTSKKWDIIERPVFHTALQSETQKLNFC